MAAGAEKSIMALGEVSGDGHLPGSLVDSGSPCSVDFIHLETNHLTVRYAKFREGHAPEPMFDSGALLSLPSDVRPNGWPHLMYSIKENDTDLFNRLINIPLVNKNKQIRYNIEVDTLRMGSEGVFVPRQIQSLQYDMHDGKEESMQVFGVTTDDSRPYAPEERCPDLSPLHLAVIYKRVRMVKELLDHGGNTMVRDAYGIWPIQYAAMMGQWPIYDILKSNMTLDEEGVLDVLMAAGEFAAVVRRCDRLHEIRSRISGLPQARFDRCVRMVVQQLSQDHINDVEDNIEEVFFPIRES